MGFMNRWMQHVFQDMIVKPYEAVLSVQGPFKTYQGHLKFMASGFNSAKTRDTHRQRLQMRVAAPMLPGEISWIRVGHTLTYTWVMFYPLVNCHITSDVPLPCNSDHNWTAQTEHHKNGPNWVYLWSEVPRYSHAQIRKHCFSLRLRKLHGVSRQWDVKATQGIPVW